MPIKSLAGKTVIETSSFVLGQNDRSAVIDFKGIPLNVKLEENVPSGNAHTSVEPTGLTIRFGSLMQGTNVWAATSLFLDGIDHEVTFVVTTAGTEQMKAYHVTYTITV